MDPEKQVERTMHGLDGSMENPTCDIRRFLKDFYTSTVTVNALDTAMEAAPGPPPPAVVPTQTVFNSYSGTVGNLNAADALYMESSAPAPSYVGPAQTMFSIYPQTVGNLNTANAMYMETGPAPPAQLMDPPSVYGQAAPSVYNQPAQGFQQSYGQNTMQPGGHMYNQAFVQGQGQYLPYPQQVVHNQRAPLGCGPHKYVQMVMQGQDMNIPVVGVLNGELVYGMPPGANFTSFAPAPAPAKKRKQPKQEDDAPYIRRPPNAFMLFLKEQRPNAIIAEKLRSSNTFNSATVNAILGQKWKSLTKLEQDKYYHEANRLREYHCLLHPGWSPGQNYGKKRKRIRNKAPKVTEASANGVTEVAKDPMNPPMMAPPIIPVPPVTAPHICSQRVPWFNRIPPHHHLQPFSHINDPEVPKP